MKSRKVSTKNNYFNTQQTENFLKKLADQFPDFLDLESIGKTPEGREIWLVSLTDKASGKPKDKPSLWIDGNTHASEVAGAQSILYFIEKLLILRKKDSLIRHLLKTVNFYLVPIVSPDGAEYFHRTGFEVRSSPRRWPDPEVISNLEPQDLDQDDEILTMRRQDKAGVFKTSKKNKNLLISRDPFDVGHESDHYYSLFHEGLFRNYDGFHQNVQSDYSFDYNRQFPNNFRPEGQQFGAGSFPMSSPEIHAFVKAFTERKRIFGHISLHTYGGLILQPPGHTPETQFELKDILNLELICKKAAEVSGYEHLKIQQDFKYYSRESEKGDAIEWSFEQRGVYSMTVEIWDLWKQVGIKVKDHVSRYFAPKESELLRIYSWAQRHLGLKAFFKPWKKLKHPQLGEVEIGGWRTAFLFRNPPNKLLLAEMQKIERIALEFAKLAPQMKCLSFTKSPVGDHQFKVIVIFENHGFLGTEGSQQAIRVGAVQKPRLELSLSPGQTLISGHLKQEIDHLRGRERALPISTPVRVFRSKNNHQCRLEWIVQGSGLLNLKADFQRGGLLEVNLQL
jgi:hypothetical protein